MRKITITKKEFEPLYVAMGSVPSDNDAELETSFNTNRKLRGRSIPKDVKENEFPARDLLKDEETFLLEEAEWILMRKRFKKAIPSFASHIDEELYSLKNKLEDPEKFEPSVEPEDQEAD